MENGSYTARRVNFADYAAAFFNPFLFTADWRARLGCGASALSLLTGVLPEKVARENGDPHYSDAFMISFLRRRHYLVKELTLCRMSDGVGSIGRSHVILLSQLIRRNEATWGVIFNATYYHNFEWYTLDTLSLLNKPVVSAYLVLHPKWRRCTTRTDKAPEKSTLGKQGVRFSALNFTGSGSSMLK